MPLRILLALLVALCLSSEAGATRLWGGSGGGTSLPVVVMSQFGVTCDGVTDDYTAIVAALDSVTARRGHFIFPVGICVYSQPIVFESHSTAGNGSGIIIEGAANDKTRLSYTGTLWGMVLKQEDYPSSTGENIDFFAMRDISLAVTSSAKGAFFSTLNVERSEFRNVRVLSNDNSAGTGFLLRNHSMSLFERVSCDSIGTCFRLTGVNTQQNVFEANKVQTGVYGWDISAISANAGCYASGEPYPCCTGDGTGNSTGFGLCAADDMAGGWNTFIGNMGRPLSGFASRRNVRYSGTAVGSDTWLGYTDLDTFGSGTDFGSHPVLVMNSTFEIAPSNISGATFLNSDTDGDGTIEPDVFASQELTTPANVSMIVGTDEVLYLNVDQDNDDTNTGLIVAKNGTANLGTPIMQVLETDLVLLNRGTDLRMYDADDSNYVELAVGSLASNFTVTIPGETGTICTTGSVCTGYQGSGLATLLAGRASTGNDTILSTNGAGTLYGSGTTANDLTLRANDDNTTTGEINLNAPVVELYPSYPASSTVTASLMKATPTFTSSGDAAQWTMVESSPVMSVTDTSANSDFHAGGSLARTGTTESTLYADSGFYMNRAYTSATTAGPLFPDAFYANWTATQTGSATANSTSYIPISFLDKSQIRANDSATWTLDDWWQFAAYGSINDQTSGALTVTNRHAFHVEDVTLTNTPTLTNNVGFHCVELAAGANDICYESVGTDDEFRHAGRGRFGATGAPTASFDLDVQGAAKVADYQDLGDDIADLTTNTVSILDIQPTVDISSNGTLRGVLFSPTTAMAGTGAFNAFMTQPILNNAGDLVTVTALGMGGTITQTASSTFGPTAKIMNHTTTYTTSTANAEPVFQVYGVSEDYTVSSSATSGTAASNAVIGHSHNPIINQTGSGGTLTLATFTGFDAAGRVAASAGGTTTVTTRRGFLASNPTVSGAGTATITTNIGFDAARQTAGATDIGLRVYGITTPKVDNTSTCTACTDADISWSDSSFIRLTGNSAKVVSGIGGGVDGARLTLYNQGSGSLTIDDDDSAAAEDTAASQILTMSGADKACTGVCVVSLIYDSGASRWVVTGVSD